jgi:hypothetical protein
MQKLSVVDAEFGEKDSITCSGTKSVIENLARCPKWKRTRMQNVRCVWACVLAAIVIGLLTTLVVFALLIQRDENNNGGPGILTPPLVAPGVIPEPGQSVLKSLDGLLMVCGHSQGQYTCQAVDPGA